MAYKQYSTRSPREAKKIEVLLDFDFVFPDSPKKAGLERRRWELVFALDHVEFVGPINATAPNPVTNKDFSTALGKVLGRPSFLPTPGFALRIMLGEVSQVITQGQRVLPRKALAAGYAFKFTDVEAALRDLLGKYA